MHVRFLGRNLHRLPLQRPSPRAVVECNDAGMSARPKFPNGATVEVWIEKRGQWVRGHVLEHRTGDDGTHSYFIQLSGYMAMQASNPDHWITEDAIRER